MKTMMAMLVAVLVLTNSHQRAQADLLAYEGFDYGTTTDGINAASLIGGIGFSGAWSSSDSAGANPFFNITTPGDSWGLLEVTRNRLDRTATGGVEAIARSLTGDLDGASELWFSVLHDADATSQFAVAGDSFADGSTGSGLPTTPAFGFRATANDTGTLGAVIWSNDGSVRTSGATSDLGDGLRFLVGRISFDSGTGGADVLSLFDVGTDLALGTAFSTAEADVDQTLLDTLTISSNRGPGFDEIRIGTSFSDVVIPVPEPGGLLVLSVMIGGMGFRRRR